MKQLVFFVFIITSSAFCIDAQESQDIKKPAIGLHFFYNDFKTAQLLNSTNLSNVLKNKLWNKPSNMEGGFGLDYMQGFSKNIDFIGTLNGSWVDYLLPGNILYGSSNFLLDIDAGAHFKLFTDKHIFSPFLIVKAGYSKYENLSGLSLLPGAGLQINLFREAFVIATFEYRSAISNSLSNQMYYSIGIATNIGKKKVKPVKVEKSPVPEPVKKEVVIPPKDVIVTVVDEATGQPLPYVAVSAKGSGGKMLNGSTDNFGRITFYGLSPAEYAISGMLNNVRSSEQDIKKEQFASNNNQISILLTHNDPRFTLAGVVINKTKNFPEGGANVDVTNETVHHVTTIQSHTGDGIFHTQLTPGSDFTVVGRKAGFISNIEKVTTKGLNRSATLYVKLELAIEEAKVGQSVDLKNIYFEVGKANLNTDVSSDLDKLVRFLKDNPAAKLEIQGHTDNSGSLALNNRLSQARANSVVLYLTKKGISSERLIAKGYGPSVPVSDNTTTEGRAKNRRVIMKVLR